MTAARLRLTLVLAGLALGGIVLLTWTQAWIEVALVDATTLEVTGQAAAPVLSTLGIAVLALSAALTIAGPVLRRVLGVVQALIGVAVVSAAATVIVDPIGASASTITEATAVAGSQSVAALVASVAPALWPWLAAAGGALLTIVGSAVVITASRWPRASRKYEAEGRSDPSSADAWDALSEGDDPTSR
jgi:hypothetical protein